MEKGRVKKEKKYLSIILIPHFSDDVKKLRISSPFVKLTLAFIILFSISLISFAAYNIGENVRLRSNVSKLSDLNNNQQKLLEQKAETITGLEENKKKASQTAKDFMDKYREMTDNYITNRSSSSRDSVPEKNTKAFVSDLKDLKSLIDDFSAVVDSNEKLSSSLTDTEIKLNGYIQSIPTRWPVSGTITSTFNIRRDPFTNAKKFHEGIDIAAPYGTLIRAAGDGIVEFSGRDSTFGNAVIINHGHGLKTLYGHASMLLASEGKKVKKGDIIARVGSTGRSTGAHCHFEVLLYDNPVDPLKYLN